MRDVHKHLYKLWCTQVYRYAYEHVLGMRIRHSTGTGVAADINPDACTDASIEVCICMCIDAAQGSLGLEHVYEGV